jgi:endonuclease/exonuclease/phosphatase family metal-dependent hydrolase
MKLMALLSVIFVTSLIGLILWAAYPWSLQEIKKTTEVVSIETDDMMEIDEHPSVIKILTFNLGFLYGKGSEGPGYEHRERDYYETSLKKVSEEIKDWGADIVFLQEIDFDSSRSAHINQAQFIAKTSGYPFVVEASSWESHYIPFPYWPLKNNFGSMKSGGAILSKYPILKHDYILLAKPRSQPWWYNLFYLHRYFQRAEISVGDRKFKVVNLHLEAFDKVDRKRQIRKLAQFIKAEKIDMVAGDFNILPKSAAKRTKFFSGDDYENDPGYEEMLESGLQEVIPDEIYAKEESRYFTFPSWAPDRRLDYIWYKPSLKMMKAEVLPSASSDHLPLRASFQIDGPRFNPYSQ